ncbi:MAG: hypothetical protein AAFR14_10545, partial [Bacteroidota bacterium]
LDQYIKYFSSREDSSWIEPFGLVYQWQQYWDIDRLDFAEMLSACLEGDSAYWQAEAWYPKQVILRYAHHNGDLVRSAFIDLFDENRDVVGRIHRFLFILNELKHSYRSKDYKANTHDHDDRRMIMHYLTCRYPEQYCHYQKLGFEVLLRATNAKNVSTDHDLERYIKVSKIINTFLSRREDFMRSVYEMLVPQEHIISPNKLLVTDVLKFVSASYN